MKRVKLFLGLREAEELFVAATQMQAADYGEEKALGRKAIEVHRLDSAIDKLDLAIRRAW